MTALRSLHARLVRLEAAQGAAAGRMALAPMDLGGDPVRVAAFIAAHRARTGWKGAVAMVAVPDKVADIYAWALLYSPAGGSA